MDYRNRKAFRENGGVRTDEVKRLASECGFELAGIAAAGAVPEYAWYAEWVRGGMAGGMRYLTDRRGPLRADVRTLLPTAKSVVCVGKLYNGPEPYSTDFDEEGRAWISRYAWGEDYHGVLRAGLERLARQLPECDWKVCVDTAPLLERALARRAGLGWIGKNTCLIHEGAGSWFFIGELLTSLELPPDAPPPDRCGSCTRCIDACPTTAIVPTGWEQPAWTVDARLCISYITIESRDAAPEPIRPEVGRNVFGCDICQDVCPWNRGAPVTADPAFAPHQVAPPLERLAGISQEQFRAIYRNTPVSRARYAGFLRNVATAMGNAGLAQFRTPLERLAQFDDPDVREHATWALTRIQ
jgi:epoxyqueuosine reductase